MKPRSLVAVAVRRPRRRPASSPRHRRRRARRAPGGRARVAAVPPGSYLAVVERGPDGRVRQHRRPHPAAGAGLADRGDPHRLHAQVSRKYGGFRAAGLVGRRAHRAADRHREARRPADRRRRRRPAPSRSSPSRCSRPRCSTRRAPASSPRLEGPATANTLVLDRISWTGARTRLLGRDQRQVTPGRNGTVLTSDGDRGRVQLLLSTSDGAVVNRFRGQRLLHPGALVGRDPAARDVRRGPLPRRPGHGQLRPADQPARPRRLRPPRRPAGGSTGSTSRSPARCGYTFVARKTRSGAMKPPAGAGCGRQRVMVDAVGEDLVLEHAASCDGDRAAVGALAGSTRCTTRRRRCWCSGGTRRSAAILVLGEVRASTY